MKYEVKHLSKAQCEQIRALIIKHKDICYDEADEVQMINNTIAEIKRNFRYDNPDKQFILIDVAPQLIGVDPFEYWIKHTKSTIISQLDYKMQFFKYDGWQDRSILISNLNAAIDEVKRQVQREKERQTPKIIEKIINGKKRTEYHAPSQPIKGFLPYLKFHEAVKTEFYQSLLNELDELLEKPQSEQEQTEKGENNIREITNLDSYLNILKHEDIGALDSNNNWITEKQFVKVVCDVLIEEGFVRVDLIESKGKTTKPSVFKRLFAKHFNIKADNKILISEYNKEDIKIKDFRTNLRSLLKR